MSPSVTVCSACLRTHPDLKLQVHELTGPEIEAQVADGTLDMGLGFYPLIHDGVMGEKLFEVGVKPNIVIEIDSVDALQRVVEQGAAAALLPGRMARRTAKVQLIDVSDPRPVRAAGLIWRRSRYRSACALAFADQLSSWLREQG